MECSDLSPVGFLTRKMAVEAAHEHECLVAAQAELVKRMADLSKSYRRLFSDEATETQDSNTLPGQMQNPYGQEITARADETRCKPQIQP